MPMKKTLLALLGYFLVALGVTLYFVLPQFVYFSDEVSARRGSATLDRLAQDFRLLGPGTVKKKYIVQISYPIEMRENETTSVDISLDVSMSMNDSPLLSLSQVNLPYEGSATLESAGFDIAPEGDVEKYGVPPLLFAWTIRPKSEGKHILLMNIAGLHEGGSVKVLDQSLTINGSRSPQENVDLLKLPVTVLTVWGISRITFELGSGIVALIGFLLTYPLLVDLLRRFVPTGIRSSRRRGTKR